MFSKITQPLNGKSCVLRFQKLAKMDHFGIFYELLSTQKVNVARFARNVVCDFLGDFQTVRYYEVSLMSNAKNFCTKWKCTAFYS